MTITKSKLFKPLREWMQQHNPIIGDLMGCFYCLSHWIAAGWMLILPIPFIPTRPIINFILSTFATVSLATIIVGLMFRLTMFQENEIQNLKDLLKSSRDVIALLNKNQ
jgi:hypothetical protein